MILIIIKKMGNACDSLHKAKDDQKPPEIKIDNTPQKNGIMNQSNLSISTFNTNMGKDNNINTKVPALNKYDPKKLEDSVATQMSLESSVGYEIISDGGKIKPGFQFPSQSLTLNGEGSLLKSGALDVSQKPISEINSFFDNKNINDTNQLLDNKPNSEINTVKPILPIMLSQGVKKNNLNNLNASTGSRINVSLHENGSGSNYLYIPKNDFGTLPNFSNITDKADNQ